MKRGRFISLEGGEGVGKSTNLLFIRELLEQQGIDLLVTREPGGTPLAEKIRQLLLEHTEETLTDQAELLLVFAARAQHIQHVILPALQCGQWVLCDRFIDATYAYQGGGRQLDQHTIAWLENTVLNGLVPDLTLLLDAPVETGLQRAQVRGELDRFELEELAFFQRVRQAYLLRAAQHAERFRIIQACRSLPEVQQQIRVALASLLPKYSE
ncbi:dTMP kinase [Methylomonas paludis]|uniref:Thymidylate kinase n=1 Tax=Methylomonas paludis TaxID=1173101 RepID=A0A975MPA1_9GAMM|nr:dTMP kinase [Methylomonas paludis]QWF71482.1 dTMP kinase [Methylomonas paludis]